MNGSSFIADTNILISILQGNTAIAEFLDQKTVYVSFITEMEILSKPHLETEDLRLIKSLLKECVIVEFSSAMKENAISLRRKFRLKLPDAIIAASCQQLGLPLITMDKDFAKVKDITTLVLTT